MEDWDIDTLKKRNMVEEILVESELREDLQRGKKLTIYQGFDPTSPTLHIGHMVSLRILRWFQLKGHRVIFLIGDFTGQIGDPTEKSTVRKQLTHEEVLSNARTYKEQVSKILSFEGDNPVEIRFNSEWLDRLTFKDVIELAAKVTVQQIVGRDYFSRRLFGKRLACKDVGFDCQFLTERTHKEQDILQTYREHLRSDHKAPADLKPEDEDNLRRAIKPDPDPLYLHEFLYPIMQGYDAVAMAVDAELGGRDQLFNMQVGRDLVRIYLKKSKHLLMTPLLPGLDGRKMGKTEGNTVDLTEHPISMFFKLTLVKDSLLPFFLGAITDVDDAVIEDVKERLKTEQNLQDARELFAFSVVRNLHGEAAAALAQQEFRRVIVEGEPPREIPPLELSRSDFATGEIGIVDLVIKTGLVASKSEARRLIGQKGIRLNGEPVDDAFLNLDLAKLGGAIMKIGKRGYVKVRVAEQETF